MDKIDAKFCKRLRLTLSMAFFSGGSVTVACWVALFVLLTGLTEQMLAYFVGLISSGYYLILIDQDWPKFVTYTVQSFGLVLAMTFVKSAGQLMAYQCNIAMRRAITYRLHEKYMNNNSFCYLNVVDSVVDNVDQRITRDVDAFCTSFSTMAPLVLISPFTIGYYTFQTVKTAGWAAPGMIVAFFIVATIINRFFVINAGRRVFMKQKEEGNFRHKHSMLRSNAESGAFYGQAGAFFERESLDMSLDSLIFTMYRLSIARFFVDLASSFWQYSGSILTYFIIAIPLKQGFYAGMSAAEIGALISKNSFICMYLIYCFTSLIGLSDDLSDFVGTVHRIGQLAECMNPDSKHCDRLISAYEQQEQSMPLLSPSVKEPVSVVDFTRKRRSSMPNGSVLLQLRGITITTPAPNSKVLIRNLSFEVKKGANILITGPSGCGKSSLFRTLAGIWPLGGGEYEFFGEAIAQGENNMIDCLFMPQTPYLTVGTIADNLVFPSYKTSLSVADEQLMRKVLQMTGLEDRILAINQSSLANKKAGGSPVSLSDVMSPGEIQRFMFARLLFHSPLIAFVDEPTSSLDAEFEQRMFAACQAADITLVTIAHRPERLSKCHSQLLRLSSDNPDDWTLSSNL